MGRLTGVGLTGYLGCGLYNLGVRMDQLPLAVEHVELVAGFRKPIIEEPISVEEQNQYGLWTETRQWTRTERAKSVKEHVSKKKFEVFFAEDSWTGMVSPSSVPFEYPHGI